VKILLDTHIALWAIIDSPRLTTSAKQQILDRKNSVWISVVSLWEISIKYSIGKGDIPIDASQALGYFRQAGYQILPIYAEHTLAIADLPKHHQDPFDRLLIAQAMTEPMRLMSHDTHIAKYGTMILVC
jgi:PIN domain nuclease of toxin-antitoxin system